MKREIRFRGKDVFSGKWVYGDLAHNQKITREGLEPRVMVAGYEVDPKTVGQFTGLHDKNGTEIYEGDILGTKEKVVGWVKGGVRGYCYDVVYVNHPAGEKRWALYSTIVYDYPDKIAVIGNVHDNPELLKGVTTK